jgi:Ca2+/Na+ antiporter
MELLNYAMTAINLFWQELAVVGAIMVSAIIVLMGILKPIAFNRIPYKALRKSALALSNVFLSFVATAIYFVIRDINWELYVLASLITSVACIVTYWLYENTHLREGIHKLGDLAIDKIAHIAKLALAGKDVKTIDDEIKKASEELKATAQSELKLHSKKSKKTDDEWKNL